jgi:hypothetical protein
VARRAKTQNGPRVAVFRDLGLFGGCFGVWRGVPSLRNNPCVLVRNSFGGWFMPDYTTNDADSSTNQIAIYNICFIAYNIIQPGKLDQIIDKLVKNHYVYTYTGKHNWCWFAPAIYHEHFKTETKTIHPITLEKLLRKEIKTFTKLDKPNDYPGFNMEDLDRYLIWKNISIRTFTFNTTSGRYEEDGTFLNPNNEEAELINIAIVNEHILYLRDVERATGCALCPKCNNQVFDLHSYDARVRYNKHVENCDGKKRKKLVLNKYEKPYCPKFDNETYSFLLSKNQLNLFKPRTAFITYDTETMMEPLNLKTGQTTITGINKIIIITSTTHTSTNNTTLCFSLMRDGPDFITKWLRQIFNTESEKVMKDNSYEEDIPFDDFVPVIGFNNGKFDNNLLLPYLHNEEWTIKKVFGNVNSYKMMSVKNKDKELRFLDFINFITPAPLADVVQDFCNPTEFNKNDLKAVFPHDAYNSENYEEFLLSKEVIPMNLFYNSMKDTYITREEYYESYLYHWYNLKEVNPEATRFDYFELYAKKDTEIMVKPILNVINHMFEDGIDMLHFTTLASCANALKYGFAYDKFDINGDYTKEDNNPEFIITENWLKTKMKYYNEQDKKAKREIVNNITLDNLSNLYHQHNKRCYICNSRFTKLNKPTFDRIDNKKSHSIDNIKLACIYCNVVKSDRGLELAKLHVQLKKFMIYNNLPSPPTDQEAVKLLEDGKTGGLANVMHKVNKAGETKINHLFYEKGKVISRDTENITTHITSFDASSQYPSAYGSIENEMIDYTNNTLFMPGRLIKHYTNKEEILQIINNRNLLFITRIKGHIPEDDYGRFINLPPIFRNIILPNTKERKLTHLLSTMNQYMVFTNYYLWFLLDRFNFIIDDVKELSTYTKHTGFNGFTTHFYNRRLEAKKNKNRGLDKYCKMILNAAFGKDAMNEQKFTKNMFLNAKKTLLKQSYPNHVSTKQIKDDFFAVQMNSDFYKMKTPLQCAVWTLDNAKYWYLKFIYDFLFKAFDTEKFHFIEGDTDSAYWAVSGNPKKGFSQGFDYIIKDKEFYEKNYKKWIGNKLLGFTKEREGDEMIALAPKCYYIHAIENGKWKDVNKSKGVNIRRNRLTKEQYIRANKGEVIKGKNVGFQVKKVNGLSVMTKTEIVKDALTPKHNKMICLPNGCCAPYILGLKETDYCFSKDK